MLKTVEAVIDGDGRVRLLEEVGVAPRRRALVAILEGDASPSGVDEAALVSEQALDDWNRAEEDDAWSHLQPSAT